MDQYLPVDLYKDPFFPADFQMDRMISPTGRLPSPCEDEEVWDQPARIEEEDAHKTKRRLSVKQEDELLSPLAAVAMQALWLRTLLGFVRLPRDVQ
ncbi:hypothetical protein Pyn_14255 [Prunus yedoensis var. nudiflora]|uniref:Uncharacterized protein n=1 Tax=Prunus yedoensis var. nudiflora TaxID=2094558 RepID=A0A314XY28_PRUYE|nr:hypothetical protein Pyn_14255 [Prunus yedoensis var. nudiflora]